jgi:two-component sensor histidine kinase
LNNRTEGSSSEAARALRRRRLYGIFLAAWTVFAFLAVWWLVRRAGAANVTPVWIIEADALSSATLAERIGAWFKLVDLNFHGIYPFILLAPYVICLGARFHLEQGQWRVSLPVHLAGCALFVVACHILAAHMDWGRQVVVTLTTDTRMSQEGKQTIVTTGRTNLLTTLTNPPLPPWPGPWGGGAAGQTPPGPAGGMAGSAIGWTATDQAGPHNFFLWRHWASQLLSDLLNLFAYAALLGLVHAVHFYHRSREREGRAAVLEAQLTKARLNALQAQLHPHFLFNALNAISTLLRRDTRAAQDALTSFSELLRLALCHSTQPEVSLREDVEFLRRYVEIQQTRLGDRLRFEEEIDPATLDHLVPALLLQPLVENAIRHGIEPSPDPGLVRVAVHLNGTRLLVLVEDNGAGLSTKQQESGNGAGIGLQNLRSRLETLYGDQQHVEVGTREGGGVSVKVEIPLRQASAPSRVDE